MESYRLAYGEGQWEQASRRALSGVGTDAGNANSYLYRRAADSALSAGRFWDAVDSARKAVGLARNPQTDMGSGLMRSLCQEADARICVSQPMSAWKLYSEAVNLYKMNPLPRYYRGHGLLLIARLLGAYRLDILTGEEEVDDVPKAVQTINDRISLLVHGVAIDLKSAEGLLDDWGLIPESYQYRNFHLVPTMSGQALARMLVQDPGDAARGLSAARQRFPKDDSLLREYLFATCWERGVQREYGKFALNTKTWDPLKKLLRKTYKKPPWEQE